METQDNGLLAIEVDADDYAETAAGDTPSVSRTYQSEADFQGQKASYTAKIDGGRTYADLILAVPILSLDSGGEGSSKDDAVNGHAKARLSKKDTHLLGYAVGELYYDREYARVVDLCERVKAVCDVDAKTVESLERWMVRCRERIS